MYKVLIHYNSSSIWVTRQSTLVIKVGVVYVNIHVSSHLKEELTWAIDKRPQIIGNTNVIKNSYTIKNLKNKPF